MRKIIFRLRAETIMEVLVAMTILVLILTAVFSLMQQSISTNVSVKDRVIALNIAREGLEGVRNRRDTNWLQFSGARREKWRCIDAACSDEMGENQYYVVDYAESQYALSPVTTLEATDPGDVRDPEYRLYLDGSRYTHEGEGTAIATPFHRQIEIEKLDICGDPTQEPILGPLGGGTGCEGAIKVVSRVSWAETPEKIETVTLETYLFDFYEREYYDK